MILALAALLILSAALLVALVCYEREFRRLARFLAERQDDSNQSIAIELRTRGTVEAASEVNRLMADTRQAYHDAEEGRRRFHEDLVSLAHDVRTPLAGAQGYLQLYEVEDDPVQRSRCVNEAKERLADIKELFDQLFEYTKARDVGRTPSSEAVVVYDAVVESFTALFPDFSGRGWAPVIDFADEGFTVIGDREDLVRVFSNLATNCLRHGMSAPTVVQREHYVVVSNRVADPASIDTERLFERFYRGDTSRNAAGSGLGLAIVSHLCERMGARVSAELDGDVLAIRLDF